MSDRYPGGIITKTPVVPSGPYEDSTAPGIWTLEQQAYYEAQGLWPTAGNPAPDPYFEYVTMLLTGEGTNGAQNNTFLDSSTNAYSITRNGAPTQGSFSPYGSLWSNWFGDSSSDKLSVPASTNWDFGSGDFTLEAWLFPTADMTDSHIFSLYDSGGTGFWDLRLTTTNKVRFYWNNASNNITSSGTVTKYIWNHIVCVRSGSTISIFINGTRDGTGSITSINNNSGADPLYLGSQYTYDRRVYGYLSNGRIVKGTAVYDATASTLTVPTSPLTAISGTQLLTFQANRFKDSSANNYTVTAAGSVQVQRFSPFNPTTPYSTTTIGGSAYLVKNTSDYLQPATNVALGSSDFTIESWVYYTGTSGDGTIICEDDGGTSRAMMIYRGTGTLNMSFFLGTGSGGWDIINGLGWTTQPKLFTWNHFAAVRSGNNVYLYCNGVRENSTTISGTVGTRTLRVGAQPGTGTYTDGYLSDTRMVVGTALYTGATYTVPTAPLTAVSNTQLLLNYTNAGIYDSAMRNNWITNDTAQISTTQKKFGSSSMWFDSSNPDAYLKIPMGILNTALNTATFTIETWVYRTTGGGSYQCILSGTSDTMDIVVNGSDMFITSNTSNGTHIIDGAYTQYLPVNTWVHLALVCQAGMYYLYFDGINRASGSGATGNNSRSTDYTTNYTYRLGARGDMYGIGYLDDFRITTGIARYPNGTTFTPPTKAFPTY